MTKDMLITISGTQMIDEEGSDVEIIVRGDYYQKNEKRYILYGEMMEGFAGKAENMIKIFPSGMDIIKKGIANTHTQFRRNGKDLSCYTTPLDDVMAGIQTSRIKINEELDSLLMNVDYSLDINYERLSDYSTRLDVQSCPQQQRAIKEAVEGYCKRV